MLTTATINKGNMGRLGFICLILQAFLVLFSDGLSLPKSDASIVIVGAGMSGLSAASALREFGFTNVRILEGRNRIGGRIFTKPVGRHTIEIGAQWIHGEEDNSIFQIANPRGLVDNSVDDIDDAITNGFFQIKDYTSAAFIEKFLEIMYDTDEEGNVNGTSLGSNLQNALKDNYKSLLMGSGNKPDVLMALLDWCMRSFGIETSADVFDVSPVDNYKYCPGRQDTELRFNYYTVVRAVAETIPSDWIHLKSKVKEIIWKRGIGDDSKVQLELQNGSFVEADHVIVTVPLGYLKKHAETMFKPKLPHNKLKAIKSYGFGTVNKIFMFFDKPFWGHTRAFDVLWLDDKDFKGRRFYNATQFPMTQKELAENWMRSITYITYVRFQPNVLCAWIEGPAAAYMEHLSDAEVIDKAYEVLQMATTRNDIPRPRKIIRSAWASDPFAYGSYSYGSVDSFRENTTRAQISRPLKVVDKLGRAPMVVQFAGEATHPYYFSTVHGAYDSGRREALRLKKYYDFWPEFTEGEN